MSGWRSHVCAVSGYVSREPVATNMVAAIVTNVVPVFYTNVVLVPVKACSFHAHGLGQYVELLMPSYPPNG